MLFVCGHNAGRSIAAEAVARKRREGLVVASAGTTPGERPNPRMVTALAEAGYNTVGLASKGLEAVGGLEGWDKVVTMGCMDEGCPTMPPGVAHEDWGLPDPAADPAVIPGVLAEIERRVAAL